MASARRRGIVLGLIVSVVLALSAVPVRGLYAMVKPADSGPMHRLDDRVSNPGVIPCTACHDRASSWRTTPEMPGPRTQSVAHATTRCSACHASQ